MKVNPDAEFEYKTSFAAVPADFPSRDNLIEQLKSLNPVPPRGKGWRLSGQVMEAGTILFFWERPRKPDSASASPSYRGSNPGYDRNTIRPERPDNFGNR